MATYYCDTGLGSGLNDGTTMDNAYQSIKTALERLYAVSGDVLWIRRRSAFNTPTANITANSSSDVASYGMPIRIMGWPRATWAITSSDWTNGSTSVTVDDANMARMHLGRYITSPSGKKYLITRVVDASTIIIDREYAGATVTNQGATIAADEDYVEAQAINDSGWTETRATWNADAQTLPVIDFGNNAYQYYLAGTNGPWWIKNLDFQNGTATYGTIYFRRSKYTTFEGCLFYQSYNNVGLCIQSEANPLIKRCIFVGYSPNAAQELLQFGTSGSGSGKIVDCAIYGSGARGLYTSSSTEMVNVNIGVEIANSSSDISYTGTGFINGIDVKLGGTNGMFSSYGNYIGSIIKAPQIAIENYGKILGASYKNVGQDSRTSITRYAVVAGSGDPYKRTGGADDVLKIFMRYGSPVVDWGCYISEWRFWADTTSKSYRVYCQQVAIPTITATQAFLELSYTDEYTDPTAYHNVTVVSDETITVRSDASDWSQYLELTNIQPAVAGWVTIRLKVQIEDGDGYLYVDPMVVIS